MNGKKVFGYPGQLIDIQWDERLCIHIAECGQSEGELFVGGRDPGCLPDSATPAKRPRTVHCILSRYPAVNRRRFVVLVVLALIHHGFLPIHTLFAQRRKFGLLFGCQHL